MDTILDNMTFSPKVPGYYICIATYKKREIDTISFERFTERKISEHILNPSHIYIGPIRIPEIEEIENFYKRSMNNG